MMNRAWKKSPVGARGFSKWVRSRGSLTERIMARCGDFRVNHVSNRYCRVNLDETDGIGCGRSESALVREVYLCCNETPVVFAHSVARRGSLKGPWRNLKFLGQRSLGSAFLASPKVRRDALEFLAISARHPLYEKSCRFIEDRPPKLWARRSLFSRGRNSILVTEVFLPKILERSWTD